MKKILFSLLLLSSPLYADRLGGLNNSANVLLSTQSSSGGVTIYPATGAAILTQGATVSWLTASSVTVSGLTTLSTVTVGGWSVFGGSVVANSSVTIAGTSISTSAYNGLTLKNLTLATLAAGTSEQYSPEVHFAGSVWQTGASSGSKVTDWKMYSAPTIDNGFPSPHLIFSNSVSSSAYAKTVDFGPDGTNVAGLKLTNSNNLGTWLTLNNTSVGGIGGTKGRPWLINSVGTSGSPSAGGLAFIDELASAQILTIGSSFIGYPLAINTTNLSGGFGLKVNGAGYYATDLTIGGTIYANGSGLTNLPAPAGSWSVSGSDYYYSGGKVSVGATPGSYGFEVTGTSNFNGDLTGVNETLSGALVSKTIDFASLNDNGTQGGNFGIDFNNGNYQRVTISGTGSQITFTPPASGVGKLVLEIIQNSGGNTIDWAGSSPPPKWPGGTTPTLSAAGGAVDVVSCFYDGSYLCTASLDFQ